MRRLPSASLRLLLAAAASVASGGTFATSLHSNFVVNLDFESGQGSSQESSEKKEAASQVVTFAGGQKSFKCELPSKRGASIDESKVKTHFRSAKLAPLKGRCWTQQKDYWTYDICFGRRIVQYRADTDVRFSLGEHAPELDDIQPNGTVSETFTGGTGNRSTELRYVCGSFAQKSFQIDEIEPLRYIITVAAPGFCAWREEGGVVSRTSSGQRLLASSLLEDLRGSCLNLTQGWWTYEYCYPDNVNQFHANGAVRDPEYSLGALVEGTTVDEVNMELVRVKPSVNPRERATPSGQRVLRYTLRGGTVCDETHRPRATTVQFQCPANWREKPESRMVSINEGMLCEYEMIVTTPLLCGHQRLLPVPPRGKEVIQCDAQPL